MGKLTEKKVVGEYLKEIEELENKISHSELDPKLLLRLGECYVAVGHSKEAEVAYRKITDIPVSDDVKAEAFARIGYLENDVSLIDKAIKLNEKPEYLYNRANRFLHAYFWTKDKKILGKVEKDLTKCIKKEPDFFAHYELRAMERLEKGDEKGAASDIISSFACTTPREHKTNLYHTNKWKALASKIKDDKTRERVVSSVKNILEGEKD